MPDLEEKILLIEDVDVEPYNIDRMISHLDLAGIFRQVAGVIFGKFESCVSKDPKEGSIDEVITEWSSRLKIPCIKNFPYSHGENNCVLPIGGPITLDASSLTLTVNNVN